MTTGLKRYAPVLKLNKSWLPISSSTFEKTVKHLFNGKAKVLDPDTYQLYSFLEWMKQSIKDGDQIIYTSSGAIKLPEFIIFTEYNEDPNLKRKVVYNRRNVWKRDAGFCQFCGCRPNGDDWEIDHVIPRSKGGMTGFTNCVICCTACNRKKADRTPEQAGMQLIRTVRENGVLIQKPYKQPKQPRWNALYSIKKKDIPPKWRIFLKDLIAAMYWDTPLDE